MDFFPAKFVSGGASKLFSSIWNPKSWASHSSSSDSDSDSGIEYPIFFIVKQSLVKYGDLFRVKLAEITMTHSLTFVIFGFLSC